MSSGFVPVRPEGYVLQNASRSVTLTQLLRAASLGFIFHLLFFCICTAWGNHFHTETLQGSRIYCTSQLEIIYFD